MLFGEFPFVGGFRELPDGSPEDPSIRPAVRATEATEATEATDEDGLVRYPRAGTLVVASPALVPDALSGTGGFIPGPHLHTDGHRLRFSDPAHHVKRHHVELAPAFVEHARRQDRTAPQADDEHLEAVAAFLFTDEGEPD